MERVLDDDDVQLGSQRDAAREGAFAGALAKFSGAAGAKDANRASADRWTALRAFIPRR